jgi:hypothetical protein
MNSIYGKSWDNFGDIRNIINLYHDIKRVTEFINKYPDEDDGDSLKLIDWNKELNRLIGIFINDTKSIVGELPTNPTFKETVIIKHNDFREYIKDITGSKISDDDLDKLMSFITLDDDDFRDDYLDLFTGLVAGSLSGIYSSPVIKPGVDYVFEQNPELSKVGSKEEYSEYLDSIGVNQIAYHHSETDIDKFTRFEDGYFPKELKKKGTYFDEIADLVFFVKQPLKEEFMSKRPFLGTWGLKINNILDYNAGEKIGEGIHPGIDEGVTKAIKGGYDAVDFGRIRDNKTWSEVMVILNPDNAIKLGTKSDIQGFKDWVDKPKGMDSGLTFETKEDSDIQNSSQFQSFHKANPYTTLEENLAYYKQCKL